MGDTDSKARLRRRVYGLAAVLVLQSVCAVFFVGDAIRDLHFSGLSGHDVLEAAVAVALVSGIVFGALEMRRTIEQAERAEEAVTIASGALGTMIGEHFKHWQLTAAEANVAMLAIKGFEIAEIAEIRRTAASTVRAQLTRIYAKAGVTSRSQLVSLFIDDLLGGPLPGMEATEETSSAER
ncbi:helix-turn-helix transcriptional regulator [Nisaea nitritireducens]|uniref:helix-turn-helix transcriptional regulator n=1 Tax=Nisaea nitritireducens TaxID=568392 RepID=UPI0018675F74|nr:LuxR C-terminal-related transcriptional regulator [Nisaea nitritireducens]